MATRPTEISVLAELERYQLKHVWAGDDEVKVRCPFHDDQSPSCSVSLSKRVFNCHAAGCMRSGDLVELLSGAARQPRSVILEELSQRYDLDDVRIVEPSVVERWHGKIWEAGPLLKALRDRALTDADIAYYRLGEDQGRVTIPVPNERGDWVNVRRYLPGAAGADKMRNMRGRGQARWYPAEQLRYGTVVLVGGEMKAIVGARELNPHGVGCVTPTIGEKLIPVEMLRQLGGKGVYVCGDVDDHGRKAALKNLVALRPLAAELFELVLPLDLAAHPKGDVNDFVAGGGDLWALMGACEPWVMPAAGLSGLVDPVVMHLSEAVNARHAGRRVTVRGVVTAMDTAPYYVPRDVDAKCDKSEKFCSLCPVWPSTDGRFTVPAESPAVLEAVTSDRARLRDAVMGAVGVPRQCRQFDFEAVSHYNAEDARVAPSLELTSRASDHRVQPAVAIGEGLELNEPYEFTGRMLPHPKTQQSTLLVSSYRQCQDALSTYSPTDEELEPLAAFRPERWDAAGVEERLDGLYADLERHVTRIRMRRDMHLAMDLTWHSPLLLTYAGRVVKGWAEALVVGDSSNGKSEVAAGLRRHYGLGEKFECKNASVAGLLGGCAQMGTRWIIQWGVIPTHDKRHVTLEEMKGTRVEVLGSLTDMRSSGVAQITKIEKRQTHARTRLLGVSNPRSDGRKVASYSYGVDAAKELMGGLEDLRRFDWVYVVADADVDPSVINAPWPENGRQRHPADLCRRLVLWAWTRTPEQCLFAADVESLCNATATEMSAEYSDAVPIVDGGSMRYKLARLAAALACRTFSTSQDMRSLDVRPCHVEAAAAFLRRHYSSRACGYAEFTAAQRAGTQLLDQSAIRSMLAAMPFPYEFVESMLRSDKVEQQDLMDWCGWDRVMASQSLSLLVRKHALRRDGGGYRKSGPFIDMLRSVAASRSMPERPDFIPEAEF
jgi:hypothetical protein